MADYPQTKDLKSKRPPANLRHKDIFRGELVREFAGIGVLVFAVLFAIVVLTQLIRLLGDAVSGVLATEGVPALMGFAALNYLPVLLTLSLFLSVLLALSRAYRDSEMVVWFSAGIGLKRWIVPVLWYALPVVGVIALLSLALSPWALRQAEELKHRLSSRDDVSAATPGVFRESGQGERVYFIENIDARKGRISNVFVQSKMQNKVGTVSAKEGRQETMPNGDRFLVLLNGTRYEGTPGKADFRIVRFERYAMRIEAEQVPVYIRPLQSFPTLQLLSNPTSWNLSELEWRLSLPISALLLALMAIPLSFVNPRAGRSFNLILALLIYVTYSNTISVSNTWVGQQRVNPVVGFFGVHLLVLLAWAGFMYYRMYGLPVRRLRR